MDNWSNFKKAVSDCLQESKVSSPQSEAVLKALDTRKNKLVAKAGKKVKDPNAPKHNVSSFILYCKEARPKLKVSQPTLAPTEVTKVLSQQWNALTTAQKQKYVDLAKKEKERYDREMASYQPSEEFQTKKQGKKNKNPDSPKRATSAYLLFCAAQRPLVKTEMPELKGSEVLRELGKRWGEISAQEKAVFEEMHRKEKEALEGGAVESTPAKKTKAEVPSAPVKSAKPVPTKEVAKAAPTPVKDTKSATKAAPTPVKDTKSAKAAPAPVKEAGKKNTKAATVATPTTPGYKIFTEDTRPELEEENQDWNETKLASELVKRWNQLSDEDKNQYEIMADEESLEEEDN